MVEDKVLKNESVFSRIKEYAEEHPSLFTAMCSGLVAFLTVVLKLCYFSYQYGKLSAFHIDMNTIVLIKDTSIFNILFYIILAGIMIIINYLGYIYYRQNLLIKYFIGLFPLTLVVCTILFSNITEISIPNIINNLNYIVLIVILSIIFVPLINMIVIINAIIPPINDLHCKLEAKYNKVNKRYNINNINKQKYTKKCTIEYNILLFEIERIEAKKNKSKIFEKKIKHLLQQFKLKLIPNKKFDIETIKNNSEYIEKYIKEYKVELQKKSNNKKSDTNSDLLFKTIITAIMLIFIVCLLFIFGYSYSDGITKIDIIENANYFVENGKTTDCAVIYENDEYIIVSPCYEEDNKLKINTSYQYRTENSNITKHNMIYNTITITQYGDLTKYCKTE